MANAQLSGLPPLQTTDTIDIRVGSVNGIRYFGNDGTTQIGGFSTTGLPIGNPTKFTLNAGAGPLTASAGDLTGGYDVTAQYSGVNASTLTVRTAALMIADAGLTTGMSYRLRILNSAAGTATLTTATGVTLTGHVAILTNTGVDYVVTVTGAATMTFQSVGTVVSP